MYNMKHELENVRFVLKCDTNIGKVVVDEENFKRGEVRFQSCFILREFWGCRGVGMEGAGLKVHLPSNTGKCLYPILVLMGTR